MGLLDDYSGIGMSPRPRWEHQEILMKCIRHAYDELAEQGLRIVPEATVTNDWNDKAPDLVIFDSDHYPLSIIEITTHKDYPEIIEKCEELMERFPESEYFVYDYERLTLYVYDGIEDSWISSKDYEILSRYLGRPLLNYLI